MDLAASAPVRPRSGAPWRISLALRARFNWTATARLPDGLFRGDLDYWQILLE